MADRIDAFARRAADDHFFLSSALQEYARSEGMDAGALCRFLGCEREMLGPLGLCRRPDGERLLDDARRIAQRFKVREDALIEVIRRADVLAALRGAGSAEALAAARDRTEGQE